MFYVDKKYLLLASSYLAGFKDTGNDVYRFRCPFCGDSKRNTNKTRGYLYPIKDTCAFKCHNCGASLGLGKFIKELSADLYAQYIFEKFISPKKRTSAQRCEEEPPPAPEQVPTGLHKILQRCEPIVDLPDDHEAKKYLEGRKIPRYQQDRLFFVEDIRLISRSISRYSERNFPCMPVIVIPYFDESGNLTYLQTRAINAADEPRYVFFEVEGGDKIWNVDQVDWNQHVFVLEGVFDAMFLSNAVAVGSASSMLASLKYLRDHCKAGFTLVFDQDYEDNFEVYQQFRQAIEAKAPVVFFDHHFLGKDINQAIQNGMLDVELYLKNHTKSGLYAVLELTKLKITKVFDDKQKAKRTKARPVFRVR